MAGLDGGYRFYEAPAIHPDLADPARLATLADRWRRDRQLRIERALVPGLAAELATVAGRLPLSAALDERELSWRCLIETPRVPDPQTHECLHRLVRFVEIDLVDLVGAITGRSLRAVAPARLDVRALRKGSYRDPASADDDAELAFVLGISAGSWPAEWGGHLELLDDRGAVVARRPPGADTLDLLAPSRVRVPLLTRAVECIAVYGDLGAAS